MPRPFTDLPALPWEAKRDRVYDAGGGYVAIFAGDTDRQAENAARVGALAPALVETVAEMLAWFDLDAERKTPVKAGDTEIGRAMIARGRALVSQAIGEKQG